MATAIRRSVSAFALALALLTPAAAHAVLAVDFVGETGNRFSESLTLGWSFTVHEEVTVDGLGFFDSFLPSGSAEEGIRQDHRIRLWRDDGSEELLAETIITDASTPFASTAAEGRWLFNDIELLVLAPGEYVIGADNTASTNCALCDEFRFVVDATAVPQISYGAPRDANGFDFPAAEQPGRTDGYFGPNFRIVPEPSSLALLSIAGLLLWGRRQG